MCGEEKAQTEEDQNVLHSYTTVIKNMIATLD